MPATEQTWRQQKLLHKVFAVTGVVMLIATVWMFVADHWREWKPIQRTANRVEITMTDWRELQYQTEDAVAQHRELVRDLESARREAIDPALLHDFKQEVTAVEATADEDFGEIDELATELLESTGDPASEAVRDELLSELQSLIQRARFREDTLLGQRKFTAADRDAAVAALGLMVRDGKEGQEETQQEIDRLKADFDELTRQYQEAAAHRQRLEELVDRMMQNESAALEALDKNEAELRQLEIANESRRSTYFTWYGLLPIPGKKWLELPILDAFNSPRKIDNLWSDGLEIDYNFSKVRRFDRCTTCHQLIDKTLPGTADQPAYEQEQLITLILRPPVDEDEQAATEQAAIEEAAIEEAAIEEAVIEEAVIEEAATDGAPQGAATGETSEGQTLNPQKQLEQLYGLRLAGEGLLERSDVTVQYVRPESLAAKARVQLPAGVEEPMSGEQLRRSLLQPVSAEFLAPVAAGPGLETGDVIVEVNQDGNPVYDAERVAFRLLDAAASEEEIVLTVRRGMPSPYSSHPRLDLFVGSLSPHNKAEFACTICHEGQGSATAFKWASHSPNSVRERKDWARDYGWVDNPHWIYPMYPERFAESSCLKCHHDVVELEPSERFPDPPAPTVVQGYHLVRKYGCYGCHEITGYDGQERVGPDMRLEPNVYAAAQQMQVDPGYQQLDEQTREWAEQLVGHPERADVRRRLYEVLLADSALDQPLLNETTHTHLTPLFKDVEQAGTLRKAGPSLRFVGHKLESGFLYDWIREPKRFRDSTRMPQFFGLWGHLGPGSEGQRVAERYEPVEIQGIVTYLEQATQNFEYLTPPSDVAEASLERGRVLFEERGCLACHNHKDFPDTQGFRAEGEIVQGPDLSGIGEKLNHERGRRWLYSWIKEPTRYHARTVMPDLFLDVLEDAEGNRTDPAADIVAYLLSSSKIGYQVPPGTPQEPSQVDRDALADLTFEYLRDVFSTSAAERYAREGIPQEMRGELRGAEVELLVGAQQALSEVQKLSYIGRKTFGKYGCYGCHDVPGFEDAKPIGTGLADWGRKNTSQLAFEHITHYLEGHGPGHGSGGDNHDMHDAGHADAPEAAGDASLSPTELRQGHKWYVEQIAGNHRAGFIYQKLREPRSYDYHKTENKKYNERLRMPQFPFDFGEREAVITFVLGLVADPPSEKYIYQPDARRRAILEGQRVLDKYNCAGCHVLEPQKWAVSFEPDNFGPQQMPGALYPFLHTHFPTDEVTGSLAVDSSGHRQAVLTGMPTLDDSGLPFAIDDFFDPVENDLEYNPALMEYYFDIWQPTLLDGNPFEVGVQAIPLRTSQIAAKRDTHGGFLTRYLLPRVTEREKEVNPAAKGSEAWGWLPPPLIGQGRKVQTDWLHEFLLNPYPIRPAVLLRMPRFNMTPTEATQLVNYFAAVDGVQYPYQYSPRRQSSHLAAEDSRFRERREDPTAASEGGASPRFDAAMQIVVNNNYCVKCHLVGDFEPKGSDRAKAPIWPRYIGVCAEYLRDWIANPKSILPYTSMPVNIPYDPDAPHLGGVAQEIYPGTSIEQVDALVDLLMNYDAYARQRSLISPLVQEAPPADAATSSGGEE